MTPPSTVATVAQFTHNSHPWYGCHQHAIGGQHCPPRIGQASCPQSSAERNKTRYRHHLPPSAKARLLTHDSQQNLTALYLCPPPNKARALDLHSQRFSMSLHDFQGHRRDRVDRVGAARSCGCRSHWRFLLRLVIAHVDALCPCRCRTWFDSRWLSAPMHTTCVCVTFGCANGLSPD